MNEYDRFEALTRKLVNVPKSAQFEPPQCASCPHPHGDHIIVATVLDEYASEDGEFVVDEFPWGGWVFCPVEGCDCKATWTVSWEGLDTEAIRARIEPWDDRIRERTLGI